MPHMTITADPQPVNRAIDALTRAGQALGEGKPEEANAWMVLSSHWRDIALLTKTSA